jgi:hypothetical protein
MTSFINSGVKKLTKHLAIRIGQVKDGPRLQRKALFMEKPVLQKYSKTQEMLTK